MTGKDQHRRWVLWVAGVAMLVSLLTACATPHAIAAGETPVELQGRYTGELPAADAAGRKITLDLETSGRAALVMDYVDKGTIVQTGTWRTESSSSGTVRLIVSLTEQNGRQLDEMIVFELRGSQLVAVAYDALIWGNQGLTLNAEANIP